MRTMRIVLAGIVFGVALTFAVVEISGGWYTYRLLADYECAGPRAQGAWEPAPNQPNPCIIRYRRWHVLY